MPAITNTFNLQAEVDLIVNSIRDGLGKYPQVSHDTMLFVLLDKAGTVDRHAVVVKHHDRADILQRLIKKLGKQFAHKHQSSLLGVALVAEANMTSFTDSSKETAVIMVEALSATLTPALVVIETSRQDGHLVAGQTYRANHPPTPDHLREFIDIFNRQQPKAVAKWN